MSEQINVGTVTHRHGTNFYAARTYEGVIKQIADYVRENWLERPVNMESAEEDDHRVFNDSKVIDLYFDGNEEEFVDYDVAVLFP